MRIHVKVHPYPRQCISASRELVHGKKWDLPDETSAAQVVTILNLPRGFPVIMTVNGSSCQDLELSLLKDEDVIVVSPVMAGG